MKYSIVVPCYNEEKNIPLILERFGSVITNESLEVVLVNNGSTDNSRKVLEEYLPKYKFARLVEVKINQGYGYGILSGLRECKGEYLGWTHADMQTDPNDVIRAIELIEKEKGTPVYVKGKRKGRPLLDEFFTVGMSIFETVYLGKQLWDINAQPNIFHKDFFNSWESPPHDFSLDLYALYMAKKKGLKLIRLDVFFPERIHGSSSWNTGLKAKYKFIKRTLKFSAGLNKTI